MHTRYLSVTRNLFLCLFAKLTVFSMLLFAPLFANAQSSVELYTGTSTYTYPIVTPPGTNGMGPNLALRYNSDSSDGWVGKGWSVAGFGEIERRGPNYSPAPSWDANDTFILKLNGRSKLVYTGIDPAGNSGNYYHTQIESYHKIEYVSASNSWIVTDVNGTRYYFGSNSTGNSRQTDRSSNVVSWKLDEVMDTHGVFWTVTYDKDSTGGDLYPKQIVYSQGGELGCTPTNVASCRTVDFSLTSRAEKPIESSYAASPIVEDKLLDTITVTLGGQTVRSYKLVYDFLTSAPSRDRAPDYVLSSVTEYGADATNKLPPTRFYYNSESSSTDPNSLKLIWNTAPNYTPTGPGAQPQVGGNPANGGSACNYFIDLTGDGYPGLLMGNPGAWTYVDKPGDTWTQYAIPNPAGSQLPSLCATTTRTTTHYHVRFRKWYHPLPFSPKLEKTYESIEVPINNIVVIDIDGDGLADIVDGTTSQWYWYRNNGGSSITFSSRMAITGSPAIALTNENNKPVDGGSPLNLRPHRSIRFADMDGDGLVDIFQADKVYDDGAYITNWRFTWRKNLGGGNFSAAPVIIGSGYPSFQTRNGDWAEFSLCYGYNFEYGVCYTMIDNSTYPVVTSAPPLNPNSLSLIDVNGDGLLDLVWQLYSIETTGQQINWNTIGIHYEYLVNQGGGKKFRRPLKGDMAVTLTGTNSLPNDAKLSPSVHWIDMNGDGLTDLLVGTAGNYRYYPQRYQDGDLDPPITLSNPPTEFGSNPPKYLALTRENYLTITDFDGDGLPDIVLTPPMAEYGIYWVKNSVELGLFHKLTDVRNSMGGMSSLHYQLLHSGNSIKWVPKDMRISDKVGGPDQYTTYSFSGGKSVGWPDFEFRGYSDAVVTDAAGFQSSTKFYQDDARKGLVSDSSKDTQSDSYLYTTGEPVPGVTRVDLASHGVSTSSPKGIASTITTYDNYDDYGNPLQSTVSGDGIVSRVTTTDYAYNTDAWIVNRPSRTDTRTDSAAGNKISETWFNYDYQGNGVAPTVGDLTSEIHWNSTGDDLTVQYAYDDYGNRIGVTDAKGNTCASTGYTSKVEYDTTYYTFPVKTTNALCQYVTKTYWGINTGLNESDVAGAYAIPGFLATVTDPNNVRSDTYWDIFGRVKATVLPPDTAAAPTTLTSHFMTGVAPSSVTVNKRESVGGGTLDSITMVDGLGRTIQTKSESATSGEWITQDTFYNNRGLVESVTVPYVTTSGDYTVRSTAQPKTTTLYDARGRVINQTNTDGTLKITDYNLWDVTSTDENGNATTRSYDALNRLIKVVEPGGGSTTYRYDYYGTSPTSGGLGHNFQYINDASGNLISAPEFDTLGRKVADYDPDRSYHGYTYDPNGNRLTQSDAKIQKLTFTYDMLNRIKTKTYPDGKVITYYYDDTTAGKYCIGRLWKITDPSGSTTFSYDQRGRNTQVDKVIGGNTFTNQTSYDSLNRVVTKTYTDGEVVQNTYDAGGMLSKVHSNTYNQDYLTGSIYNPMGRVLSRTYGNGLVTSYDYYDDPSKGPTSFRLLGISTPGLQKFNYIYDDNGNIREIADYVHIETQDFGYDNLNRLTSAKSFPIFQPLATTSVTPAPAYDYNYTYDAIGNMLNGEGKTYTYPAPGAMRPHTPVSSNICGTFSYDNNGNLSTSTCGSVTKTFSWDYDNRLTQVKSGRSVLGQYTYDFAGQRVKKVEGRVTTLIPFPNYRTIRGTATKYYFANGQRIAERTGGTAPSNVYYYHPDHLGSSNVVSDTTGTQVESTLFYPFGVTRIETGVKPIEQKYNGKDFDQKTGLYDYGARFYDPSLMHFISADNTVPNTSDPQMFNRYAYVRNNPVRLVDPTGHAPEDMAYSANTSYEQYGSASMFTNTFDPRIWEAIELINSTITNANTRMIYTDQLNAFGDYRKGPPLTDEQMFNDVSGMNSFNEPQSGNVGWLQLIFPERTSDISKNLMEGTNNSNMKIGANFQYYNMLFAKSVTLLLNPPIPVSPMTEMAASGKTLLSFIIIPPLTEFFQPEVPEARSTSSSGGCNYEYICGGSGTP